MQPQEELSLPAISALCLLVASLGVMHLRCFRAVPGKRRGRYLILLPLLLVGTLFVPVFDGGDKFGLILLWEAYHLLSIPQFYLAGNRDMMIDLAIYGLPVIHHAACIGLSRAACLIPGQKPAA